MNQQEIERYVCQVVETAELTFGVDADQALLETYAREAVLDLWLTRPRVTVYAAALVLRQVRDRLDRVAETTAAPLRHAA
jgi:hypothetical protein